MTQYNLSRLAVSLNNTLTLPYLTRWILINAHYGQIKFLRGLNTQVRENIPVSVVKTLKRSLKESN